MKKSEATNYKPRGRYRARRLALHPCRSRILPAEKTFATPVDLHTHTQHPTSAEVNQLKEQCLRIRAEFDNFRKRTQKEKDDLKKFAIQEFAESLLPVLDSFDQAQATLNATHDMEGLVTGFTAILQQLQNALKVRGFEKLDAQQGHPFDPNIHEALAVVKAPEDLADNTVYDVLQNGYTLNGRVIRPARVRIAQKG